MQTVLISNHYEYDDLVKLYGLCIEHVSIMLSQIWKRLVELNGIFVTNINVDDKFAGKQNSNEV